MSVLPDTRSPPRHLGQAPRPRRTAHIKMIDVMTLNNIPPPKLRWGYSSASLFLLASLRANHRSG